MTGKARKTVTRMLPGMLLVLLVACRSEDGLRFAISFNETESAEPLDGRMLLMVSNDASREPRFQISTGPTSQLIFGIDVEGLQPGEEAVIDAGVFGYPVKSIGQIPPGDYWVQGLLHRYETFHRSDGHTVKLPMDRGEGQKWNQAPGNLYSAPKKVTIRAGASETIDISLDEIIDPYYDGEVDYGDRFEHCWNGDHTRPNAISRLRYHQMFAPKILERILESAPPGSDLTSWRY